MEQYNITGMSCAACSARVEKAVSKVEGVDICQVNLLTNSMNVSGSASEAAIIKAVVDAGYGASKKISGNSSKSSANEAELKDTETPKIRNRLIASAALLIPLMYVSMGHMMWDWPLPPILMDNHIGMGVYELILSGLIMVINQKFFISGFKGLIHKAPNMDTLVALGSSASFGYSLYALFAMTVYMRDGNSQMVLKCMDEFYFESAAMILTLITVGKFLEAKAKGRTTDALKGLMKLSPKTAIILVDGSEVETAISNVHKGDLFVVKPGASVPVDGIVIEGSSAIDESSLTGESVPADKESGSLVYAATINQSGNIICEATKVGEDTVISQIIKMVSDASATKAPIAKVADKVSGIFVPFVIGVAVVTLIAWLIAGENIGFSLARAVSVLVISCPCALGLATPVAIMVGNGIGAKNAIMFKTAEVLEETGKMQIVVLDKTGTITKGEPNVRFIVPVKDYTEEKLVKIAYSLESKSEHPLAKAVVKYASERGITIFDSIEDFKAEPGNGLSSLIDSKRVYGGNKKYISKILKKNGASESTYLNFEFSARESDKYADEGMTPLFFADEEQFLGTIYVSDVIKEDSAKAIKVLREMGLYVVMLTGDNANTANAIGKEAGVDEVVAGVLPDEKAIVISKLKEFGKVTMVGDGINDAPALTVSDVGIAIGAGTDIAIDAADIVLAKNSLMDVAAAFKISKKTLKNIYENLFWAFFYNIIGIPLAAGVYIKLFGWTLNPMFGAAAMSLSSFCVVTNALRLNLYNVYGSKNKTIKNKIGEGPYLTEFTKKMEEKEMEIKVNGMMCGHCEAHVKKALEKIEGIKEATANHTTGTVSIVTEGEVSMDDVKAAVADAGYEFVG